MKYLPVRVLGPVGRRIPNTTSSEAELLIKHGRAIEIERRRGLLRTIRWLAPGELDAMEVDFQDLPRDEQMEITAPGYDFASGGPGYDIHRYCVQGGLCNGNNGR